LNPETTAEKPKDSEKLESATITRKEESNGRRMKLRKEK